MTDGVMGIHVLTRSLYVCKIFIKQKNELNFKSNEEFLLFLLGNTRKLALIVSQVGPLLDKLLDCTVSDVNMELEHNVDNNEPMDYTSQLSPQNDQIEHKLSQLQSSTDVQDILNNSAEENETDATSTHNESREKFPENQTSVEEALFNKELQEDHLHAGKKQKQKGYQCESSGNDDQSDTSYDSDDLQGTTELTFHRKSPNQCTESSKETHRSPVPLQRKSPRTECIDKSPPQSKSSRSPISRGESAEEGAMLFDPAGLLQKSNAALQEAEEVMNINKPQTSMTIPPLKLNNALIPEPSDSADEPPKSTPQRLVLPRQTSPFKSGHLIAFPLKIANENMKCTSLPSLHSNVHSSYTEISEHGRSTAPPDPPSKHNLEQNRENLNDNNDMESDVNHDKLYICPMCNKEFKGSGRVRNCKIHINTVHLKHKPYKCNFCNVRFGYKDYMKRHLIRHHKSLFYSYDTESVLEKYTTYDTSDDTSQEQQQQHHDIHDIPSETSQ